MSDKKTANIEAHKVAIEELYYLDSSTQEFQLKISNFLLKHPQVAGISYASAELLIAEKDPRIVNAAISAIAAEIQRRSDVNAPGYRIKYARVTTNQVQRILNNEKQKRNPIKNEVKAQKRTIQFKCPHCKKVGSFEEVKREKVIGFRTTEAMDNAIAHLAEKCCISKSLLISELLFIERRFGTEIQ